MELRADTATVTAVGGEPTEDDLSIVRAVSRAVWDGDVDPRVLAVAAGDDVARRALQRVVVDGEDRLA